LKGIYVLIVEVSKTISLNIGALGLLNFPSGLYAYVGSAQNNLELRVKRHQSREKRLFWHIDYLLNDEAAKVVGVYYTQGDRAKECKIARLLDRNAEAIAGFGCSDCHCESHLFIAENFGFLEKCMQQILVEQKKL
jgi:Uri superfamily endonuclease